MSLLQEKVEKTLKLLKQEHPEATHFYVGTDTNGAAVEEFYGYSWTEIYNDMINHRYVVLEESCLKNPHTEDEYLQAILDFSNAYYYNYEERE